MKEMHGSSSRDDRQKREQQRQEKEMAKFAQMYPFALINDKFFLLSFMLFSSVHLFFKNKNFGYGWVVEKGMNFVVFGFFNVNQC